MSSVVRSYSQNPPNKFWIVGTNDISGSVIDVGALDAGVMLRDLGPSRTTRPDRNILRDVEVINGAKQGKRGRIYIWNSTPISDQNIFVLN